MLTLFASPGACSLIVIVALEKARVPYQINNIDVDQHEHLTAEYLRVNPTGRLPALLTNDGVITETIAIILYLHNRYPAAQILPRAMGFIDATCHLAWLSGYIHPLVAQYCGRGCEDIASGMHAKSESVEAQLFRALNVIQQRLKSTTFWNDEDWSILDVYLFWMVGQLKDINFNFSSFKRLSEHHGRLIRVPVILRSLIKESLL